MDTIEARDIIKRMCKGDPTPIQLEALDIAYDILSIGLNPEQIRELKERDWPRKIEINAGIPICPACGRRVVRCYDFCPDCGQKLEHRRNDDERNIIPCKTDR